MASVPSVPPDHTLAAAKAAASAEEPRIFNVVDLKSFLKPELDEELGGVSGAPANPGTEMVCQCVPVESCVCNTVTYYSGGCSSTCTCQSTCYGCVCRHWIIY